MSLSIGTTDAKLCSAALILLGNSPINTLDGDDDVTTTCATIYPTVRKNVLSIHPWKATTAKRQLARDATDPISEWKYQYALPTDRAGIIKLQLFPTSDVGGVPIADYEIQGNRILTNETEVWADYQTAIAEVDFPAHIQQLMIYALAAELAEPLTDDSEKGDRWNVRAWGLPSEDGQGGYFRTARTIDSMGQPGPRLKRFSLVDVRY